LKLFSFQLQAFRIWEFKFH